MIFDNPFTFRPETFIFHARWRKILRPYTDDVRLEVYEAITDYVYEGRTGDLKPLATMAFSFIQDLLNRNLEAMMEKSEKCSAAGKASAARKSELRKEAVVREAPTEPKEDVSSWSLRRIVEAYVEANGVTLDSWITRKGLTREQFCELGEAVLTEWVAAGWTKCLIEPGRDQYRSLDFLKWIATQQRIETNDSKQAQQRSGVNSRTDSALNYDQRRRDLAEYVALNAGKD